jgi:hypothetical protein
MPSPRVRRLKRAKKVAKANGSKVQVVEEKLEPAIKVEPIVEEQAEEIKVEEKPKRKRKPKIKIVAEAPPAEAQEEEEEKQPEPEQSEEE